ncbi:GNAT family N-acetyltransferase [Petropleomorpha daqingensis]|uniref:RimJ/RimL family protein N-acetyltransferase n=1 Tax=Petropleomorpha daqingensis TaxID=2026353 RepID=A0A853CLE4_9ACTN|nr:RimJ/RimL family protein N-acetyltransferase [Petropleomorpha daqingensis]
MSAVRLVPFTPELLPAVQPWFEHPEVRRRLGGPDWPVRGLALLNAGWGEPFRGKTVLRAHSFLALDHDGAAVAHVGGEVYDRWAVWDPAREEVLAVHPGRAMGSAYVVDPARWGRGIGRATLRALVAAPEVADVEQFLLGIDEDNAASRAAAAAAGFVPLSEEPDAEGIVFVRWTRGDA